MKIAKLTFLTVAIYSLCGVNGARAAQADAWKADWDKTVEAAKKEGQLVIYGSDEFEKLFAEFHKKYPEIKVTGVFSRGADVAKRLMAERRADKFLVDLYLNGLTTGYNVFYKAKVLDPIPPVLVLPEVTDLSKWWQKKHHYVDPEGKYLLNFNGGGRIVMGFNTKLVAPGEIKSYWDILNPKWKGKVVGYDPSLGGSGDAMRFFYHSKSLGREFIRRVLTETDIVISSDTRQMGDWLAGGKFALSIFAPVARMDLDVMQTQGLPVDWFDPEQLKEGAFSPPAPAARRCSAKRRTPTPPKSRSTGCSRAKGRCTISGSLPPAKKGRIRCASIFPRTKCRAATAAQPTPMKPAIHSSTAPNGWIRSRSVSSSRKCWSSGESDSRYLLEE
ncbi:MAG: ABC transporter substrate-binding protein [Candidatus Binatia bacterium]